MFCTFHGRAPDSKISAVSVSGSVLWSKVGQANNESHIMKRVVMFHVCGLLLISRHDTELSEMKNEMTIRCSSSNSVWAVIFF